MENQNSKWNDRKELLRNRSVKVLFYERELWWCSIGFNIGHEENGKGEKSARPVVIFKKFNREMFWGIPVTTKFNVNPFYVAINVGDTMKRWAKISQLRSFDAKRLIAKIGTISTSDYHFIRKAVSDISTT